MLGILLFCVLNIAPVDINQGRQLFVDDYLIESTQGVVRVYNHPVKSLDSPVIWPETDAELERDPSRAERWAPAVSATSGGLWWDPVRKVFRLWYQSGWMHRLSYAESADGVTWSRPDCGVVPSTNLLLPEQDMDSWSVFPDYESAHPYENWRMMVSVAGGITDNLLYVAEDGLRWRRIGSAGQSGDRSTMFYDPFRAEWVFSLRSYPQKGVRARSRWVSPTFGGDSCQWSFPDGNNAPGKRPGLPEPMRWMATDASDTPSGDISDRSPQLYNFDAVAYESIMLGVAEILYPLEHDNDSTANNGMPKITDLHFAYSRNGVDYVRPDRRAAIASSRWGSGRWDTGYLSPIGGICVIKDERLWFYYSGMRGDASERGRSSDPNVNVRWRSNGMHFNASIGVASMRRDGFAGIVADGRGELVTKLLKFSGAHLFVNAECRFGSLAAEVLDESGKVVIGFSADDCEPIAHKDMTKFELRWRNAYLSELAGKPVRLRFKLNCGTLYSFWVSADATGKSGGYVAAGGPDYPGLRDL